MGDEATGNSMNKNVKTNNDGVNVSRSVSAVVRRFIHLGFVTEPYCSQKYHISGNLPRIFDYKQAHALGIFSDQMKERFDNWNEEQDNFLVKNIETPPKDGWPSPDIIGIIEEVLRGDGGACRPAAIFVLAACCRTQGPAQTAAYSLLKVLDNAEDVLLFVKYAVDLTPGRKGWGSGLRRALKFWYLDRFGGMELAEQITRYKQRHCWSHKDILKQIHAKPKNDVQEMLITYALFGAIRTFEKFNSMKEKDSLTKEAEDVKEYLEGANKLRKIRLPKGSEMDCSNVEEAVALINKHAFHLEHCDDTLHLVPAVWEAVLGHMPLQQLLFYLPRLRFHRLMKPGDEVCKVMLARLSSVLEDLTHPPPRSIYHPISPALVLISLKTYQRKISEDITSKQWVPSRSGADASNKCTFSVFVPPSKSDAILTSHLEDHQQVATSSRESESTISVLTSGLNNIHLEKGKKAKEIPKTSPKIVDLLSKILVESIKSMQPTGKRFIFGAGNIQDKNWCLINQHIKTCEAAALIYMCLDTAEDEGNVKGYCIPPEGSPCRQTRCAGYSIPNCGREIMQGISTNPIKVDSWINWLSQERIYGDVLVLLADIVDCYSGSERDLLIAMEAYRRELRIPKAKLVVVSLSGKDVPYSSGPQQDYGILFVTGFDYHLPFIIQHFARDEF